MPRLILTCGLPGAGKTTLAKRLEREVPAILLCPDEWIHGLGVDLFDEPFRARLEHRFKTLARHLLHHGQDVILDFGFWDRAERDELREMARALGAQVELRYLEVPFAELVRRLEIRNRDGFVVITEDLMTGYAQVFEAPDAAELGLYDNRP
ncbi:AAA family ATPase [Lentzea sp. NPDC060358]|uniref:AAA family ATPase n=1 Tax=Lentzea sp. NPDC060358 TaxID=3347103 RepID=UPI0036561EF7